MSNEHWQVYLHDGAPDRTVPIRAPALHYYADPFVVARDRTAHLFLEDFSYLAERGRIVTMTVEDGRVSAPRPVLDLPYHLSYPFLLEDDGTLYMVPESSAARSVDVYRCTRFPHTWEPCARLLEGLDAADTTLVRRDGRWWMFTSVRDRPDLHRRLCIFHADRLLTRDWIPHPVNAQKLYCNRAFGTGRCAGPMFERDGRLIRPTQYATRHYGESLRLNEVRRLSETEFEETPGERRPGHHLCQDGPFLVRDVRDRDSLLPRRRVSAWT